MKKRVKASVLVIMVAVALISKAGEAIALNSDSVVSSIAGEKLIFGSSDGIGAAAHFNGAAGIAAYGTNLYVADTASNTIRKVVISTGEVSTLTGTAGVSGAADGTGSSALFNAPHGIATDGVSLYVADTNNYTIRKIDISTGAVSTIAGSAGFTGFADGVAAFAKFGSPNGIATDGSSLYVADTWNNTIRKIAIATGEVTTLAGLPGVSGSSGGIGAEARFNYLMDITTDGTNLYVVDSGDQTIRKVVISTGEVTTLAGSSGTIGSVDGIGGAALFNYPHGISTDGVALYVADSSNNTIRKIDIATRQVSTLAGLAGRGGFADGNVANARFGLPFSVTLMGANLYIFDLGTVRKIQ